LNKYKTCRIDGNINDRLEQPKANTLITIIICITFLLHVECLYLLLIVYLSSGRKKLSENYSYGRRFVSSLYFVEIKKRSCTVFEPKRMGKIRWEQRSSSRMSRQGRRRRNWIRFAQLHSAQWTAKTTGGWGRKCQKTKWPIRLTDLPTRLSTDITVVRLGDV